jgi:predicted SAM-dependent methyltransferase
MIPFKPGQAILEVGGGDRPMFRPNMDIRPGPTVDIVHDLNKPFPIEDASYDGIYSAYLIEHLSWRNVLGFIKEMHRVIRPGGVIFVVTANLLEQCRTLVNLPAWSDKYICMLFGDQNYAGSDWVSNAHHCGFSPHYADKLFKEAGFESVITKPHPNCDTDMIIEARKTMSTEAGRPIIDASKWTTDERKLAFNKLYFDGGRGPVGGYAREGYWDYPVHGATSQKVMGFNPESVLEIGCGRGYVLKRLEDAGIRVRGLEVSGHCIQTRVVKDIVQWDITQTPWPIKDKEFDLCLSVATMEHIPEQHLQNVISEMERTCKRGLHGIDFGDKDDGFDKTHCTFRDRKWWEAILKGCQTIVAKDDLEKDGGIPPSDNLIKFNLGSFTTMFHHGWVNMDVHNLGQFAQQYGYVYRQHDITKGLPLESGCVDMLYACHLMGHINYRQGESVLKECRRVLKKNGILRVIIPDVDIMLDVYIDNNLQIFDDINDGCANAQSQVERLYSLMCAGNAAIYNSSTVIRMLKDAGFSDAKKMAFRESLSPKMLKETLDLYPTLSAFVDAVA